MGDPTSLKDMEYLDMDFKGQAILISEKELQCFLPLKINIGTCILLITMMRMLGIGDSCPYLGREAFL